MGQFSAWDFSRNCQKDSAGKNLAEVLQAEAVRSKVPVGREVKMEIPDDLVL
jgi:hypothetical protein